MSKGAQRVRDAAGWAFRKVTIWTSSAESAIATSPTLTSGSGAPSASEPKGSAYFRTGGASGDQVMYVATDAVGTWSAIESGDANLAIEDAGVLTFGAGTDISFTHDGTTGLDITVTDNDSGAFVILEGANPYLTIDTTNGTELVSLGENVLIADSKSLAFGAGSDVVFTHDGTTGLDVTVTDNDSGALTVKEGANSYLTIDTTNGVEKVSVGQDLQLAAAARDISHHLKARFFDDMGGKADTEVDHKWILNSGGDAQAIDPAIDTTQATGVWQLVSGDADGTVANDGSQLVWADVPIQLDSAGGITVVEARIRINTAITDCSLFFGLTDSTSLEEPFTNSADTITAVANDAVGFLYDTDATTDEWWGVAVDSTVKDAGNATTGSPPTVDVFQVLRMEISADGATINFFVDNAAAASLALSADVGVGANVVLYPTIVVCSTTTTSKTAEVDFVCVEVIR